MYPGKATSYTVCQLCDRKAVHHENAEIMSSRFFDSRSGIELDMYGDFDVLLMKSFWDMRIELKRNAPSR